MSDEPLPPIIRQRWADRTEFAEVAEALGVPTNQIMASMEYEGLVSTMFTKTGDCDESTPIYGACLVRGADAVLHVAAEPEVHGTWGDILAIMETTSERGGDGD